MKVEIVYLADAELYLSLQAAKAGVQKLEARLCELRRQTRMRVSELHGGLGRYEKLMREYNKRKDSR